MTDHPHGERNPFDDTKVRRTNGRIHYFLYQQNGSKQAMHCADTPSNRIFISWMQIHDAPPPGTKP